MCLSPEILAQDGGHVVNDDWPLPLPVVSGWNMERQLETFP